MFCPHDAPAETDSQGPQPHDELSTSSGGAATVKFNLWEEVHEVPNAKSLSKEEFNEIWYDPSDYDRMMDHCEKTVDLMEEGKRFKEKKLTTLGLEHWTRTGYKKRQRNKYGGIDSVLNEQFAQWEEGVDDEESISELYQASAADSKMAAAANGLKLEREVKEYLEAGTTIEVDDDCVSVLTCSVRTEHTEPSVVRWTSHSTHSRSSTHSRTSVGSYVTMMNSSNHSRGGSSVASILKSCGGGSIHSRGDTSTIGASTHSRVSVSSAGKKIKLVKKKNLLNSSSTHSRVSVASAGSVQIKSSKGSKATKKPKTPKTSTTTNTPKKLKKRISTKSDSTSTESTSDSTIDSVPVIAASIVESPSTHSRSSKASKASKSSATKKTKKVVSKKEKETKEKKSSSSTTKPPTTKKTIKKAKKASTMEEKYNKCAEFINKHFSSSATTSSSPAPKNEAVVVRASAPKAATTKGATTTKTTTTTPKIKKGVVTKPRVSTANSNSDDFVKTKIQKRTSAYSSNRNLLF